MRTMKGRKGERVLAWLQVVVMGLIALWCVYGAVRAMVQRVDVLVVVGFGIGAWAAWTLTRMSIAEMREARKER